MIRVPGSTSSLEKEKSKGADVRIVLSAHEALGIALQNPEKNIIFLAIGFETTAPGTAVTVLQAKKDHTSNFFVLCAHKTMPPAMEAILAGGTRLDGFICPGHVAAVTGSGIFDFIPAKYGAGCVVSGFEPVDILMSILMLVKQVNSKKLSVEIQYKRAVTVSGNSIARSKMNDVFEECDSEWRGLGIIGSGGLRLREQYSEFDADLCFPVKTESRSENNSCICAEILRGLKQPPDCRLFSSVCNPETPAGACMVSAEGSCNAWYRYRTAI
jgi:hydrogenase expression/formation protein HypD